MKLLITFIGGFILGIGATLGFAYYGKVTSNNGITIFTEKGKCLSDTINNNSDMTPDLYNSWSKIEVFQVVGPGQALAYFSSGEFDRIIVLATNNSNESYFDEQKINVSADKCVRQVGTYRYTTKIDQFEKTVPVILIE